MAAELSSPKAAADRRHLSYRWQVFASKILEVNHPAQYVSRFQKTAALVRPNPAVEPFASKPFDLP
ncbi:MAG: hypothetical protein ABI142_11510 [Bryocella sp.]